MFGNRAPFLGHMPESGANRNASALEQSVRANARTNPFRDGVVVVRLTCGAGGGTYQLAHGLQRTPQHVIQCVPTSMTAGAELTIEGADEKTVTVSSSDQITVDLLVF